MFYNSENKPTCQPIRFWLPNKFIPEPEQNYPGVCVFVPNFTPCVMRPYVGHSLGYNE
jgi:hypothetical protein